MAAKKPDRRQFSARLDPKTGAIDRWVAGNASNERYVFLACLSDAQMSTGDTSAFDLYALTRARSADPLSDYEFYVKSSRSKVASLYPACARQRFSPLEPVRQETLLANPLVVAALARVFGEELSGRLTPNRYSTGSVFYGAYLAKSVALVAKGKETGTAEIETRVYCGGAEDLRIHSMYRVERPSEG